MGGRQTRRIAFFAFSTALGVAVLSAAAPSLWSGHVHWLVFAIFAAMMAVFISLRVRLRGIDVANTAILGYLAVTSLGPGMATVLQLFGALGMITGRARWRSVGLWLAINAPIFMTMIFLSGRLYTALGGPVGTAAPRDDVWIVPFIAMELFSSVANALLLAIQQSLYEGRGRLGAIAESVRKTAPAAALFALSGLVLQAVYYQLGAFSLLVILAVLLVARASVRLVAEKEGVTSEMASTLARMLSMRDPYTGGHSQRVADLAVVIGRSLGLAAPQLERLRNSALLHDIGKVAVPDAVLNKPGPLDADERSRMDVHVDAGGELLEGSPHLRHLAGYVRAHHTEFANHGPVEGTGTDAAADRIPLEARILAVADAFDAMTTDRPYRAALPLHEAINRLRGASGSQFDPLCVEGLVRGLGLAPGSSALPDHGATPPADR